jgi:hypothetical protein
VRYWGEYLEVECDGVFVKSVSTVVEVEVEVKENVSDIYRLPRGLKRQTEHHGQ